jgi:hypothetical protein
MGEVEGVGEAVTGALLARAVEPATGKRPGEQGGTCPNCGSALTGPYCSQCGQRARIHRSLRTYFADFAAGMLNFEGKFWRTLPMLAWRPGELTRRYVEGERARFISPIALYLFSVFAMFAVLNINGALDSDLNTKVKTTAESAIADEQRTLAELERDRAAALARGAATANLDRRIAKTRKDMDDLRRVTRGGVVVDDGDLDDAPPWARQLIERAQRDPDQLLFNIQDAASKFSWLLIPISVPFLWLLFPLRRRTHLYDHAIFVTYSLSFMMMLVIAGGLLVWGNAATLASLLLFIPPWHMYRQLKGAYRLGTLSALVRTFALLVFAFIAIGFFAAAIVGLGLLG